MDGRDDCGEGTFEVDVCTGRGNRQLLGGMLSAADSTSSYPPMRTYQVGCKGRDVEGHGHAPGSVVDERAEHRI